MFTCPCPLPPPRPDLAPSLAPRHPQGVASPHLTLRRIASEDGGWGDRRWAGGCGAGGRGGGWCQGAGGGRGGLPQALEALWQLPVLLRHVLLEAPNFGPRQRCHGPFSRPQAPRKAQAQQRAAAATSTIAAAAEQPRSPRSNKQQAAGDGAGELHSQLTTLARSRPRSSNAPRRRQAVRGQRVGRRLKRRGTPAVPAQRLGRRRVPTWWANAPGASPLG